MKMIEDNNRNDTMAIEQLDLLQLGDGEVGYVRHLTKGDLPEMPEDVKLESAWGVYSAKGEAIALCDSAKAAWHFGADHDLQIVRVH